MKSLPVIGEEKGERRMGSCAPGARVLSFSLWFPVRLLCQEDLGYQVSAEVQNLAPRPDAEANSFIVALVA